MFCPRGDKEEGIKFFEAPKDRSWELYRCRYCDFVWRSTEKESIKNKEFYHPNFKITEDEMSKMMDKPMIPPLRKPEKR